MELRTRLQISANLLLGTDMFYFTKTLLGTADVKNKDSLLFY